MFSTYAFLGYAAGVLVLALLVRVGLKQAKVSEGVIRWITVSTLVVWGLVTTSLPLFFYQSFKISSNSMAPTLLGQHWQGTCPECGGPTYCSPMPGSYGSQPHLRMICDNFHMSPVEIEDETIHMADRIMVAKFLKPKRWDVIVYKYPADPSITYVARLVGLPGEKVHIEDGAVWINGQRQTPPQGMENIRYENELPMMSPSSAVWGTAAEPAVMGKDEYFVLGDFTSNSMDSRFWPAGAPGHQPFAVPKDHIKGVVTDTWWPINRTRLHR